MHIFAQQSLREGGLPFRPPLKTRDEMTTQELHEKLAQSDQDIAAGRLYTQEDLDLRMKERFSRGRNTAV